MKIYTYIGMYFSNNYSEFGSVPDISRPYLSYSSIRSGQVRVRYIVDFYKT